MTLFDAEGWQTDANTDCLNDSLFGQLTTAQKKRDRKGWGTPSNVQQHQNRNVKQSGKKGPKCANSEEKQTVTSKSKSHGSLESKTALTHDTTQTQTGRTLETKQSTAQQCHKQLEQTRKCESKRKTNKRNKYKHLALNTAKEDVNVEVNSEDVQTESKKTTKQQEKIKRKQTSRDDGIVPKVAKQSLVIDTTSNSETLKKKKKKRKVKKGVSDQTKDCLSEAARGNTSSQQKRHIADDARRNTETKSVATAPVTSTVMKKSQGEGKQKRKCTTDDLKHSKKVAKLTRNGIHSSSASLPSTGGCVKLKPETTPITAAMTVKRRQSPFNIARLKAVFRHETPVSMNTSNVTGKDSASKKQENAAESKRDSKVATKSSLPQQSLRERMQEKLNSARFRYINEQLYRRTGEQAQILFTQDPETFQVYHEGYQSQIAKWPVNPVNKVIEYISARPASLVVADLGCGDAKVTRSVPNRVLSFDLVAVNDSVTACDITKLPLEDNCVDIAVFCLSLMGTDFVQFLCEANRILRLGGKLLVAEVVSRFDKIGAFVRKLTKLGFSLQDKDTSNTMFVWFEFMKIGKPDMEKLPKIVLMPCVYKKR